MFSLMQNKFFPIASPRELEIIDFALKHLYEEAIFIYIQNLPLLNELSEKEGKQLWIEMRRLDYSLERMSSISLLAQNPLLMLEDGFDPEGKYKYDKDSPILSFGKILQVIRNPFLKQNLFVRKFSSFGVEDLQEIDYSLDDIWESVTAIYGFLLPKLQSVPIFENQSCSLLILEMTNHLEHIERHVELSRIPLAELITFLEPDLD